MFPIISYQDVGNRVLFHLSPVISKDWIPGKPPQRGPQLPGMTRYIA